MTHLRLLAPLLVLFFATAAWGQAMVVVDEEMFLPRTVPTRPRSQLELRQHRVNVSIANQVATTTVEHLFYNPTGQQLEGHFLFPLPHGAQVDRVSMDVNGIDTEAELLNAKQARKIYEDIVRQTRDPALLEYAGRSLIRARIFPIEPNSDKRITVTYTHLLSNDGGMMKYDYPITTRRVEGQPVTKLAMRIELKTKRSLAHVYSPSHDMQITRKGDHRAIVSMESDPAGERNVQLLFAEQPSDDPLALTLLTYRDLDETKAGYFMLLASPKGLKRTETLSKSITFILDTSGSMAGEKLAQAKRAIRFCLNNLNEKDTFDIIRFSTDVEALFGQPREAIPQNIDEAKQFIAGLKAIGGTAIYDALTHMVQRVEPNNAKRARYIVFLTDGKPTLGETDTDAIVQVISSDAVPRIFCFGIGTQINTKLLDRMAEQTRAVTAYVLPEEDLELKLSSFYRKIAHPALANPTLETTGHITLTRFQPRQLPDLFHGDQLVLFGRYRGTGSETLIFRGHRGQGLEAFEHDVTFARQDTRHTFIPRMWATRRVGMLLDEIRLHGESPELVDEVARLARRYAILTPYTSYLIVEDEQRRNVPIEQQTLRTIVDTKENRAAAARSYRSMKLADTDRSGIAYSKINAQLREQKQLAPTTPSPVANAEEARLDGVLRQQPSQVVQGRSFVQNGKRWIDTNIQNQANQKTQQIAFGSDAYFELLHKHPEVAPWMSLGRQVSFVLGDQIIEIVEES